MVVAFLGTCRHAVERALASYAQALIAVVRRMAYRARSCSMILACSAAKSDWPSRA